MNMNENRIPEMLTVKDTAKRFGIAENAIRQKAKNGEIVVIPIGKKILVNADKFIEYLNTNTLVPVEAAPKSKAKPKGEKVLGISPIRE